MLEYANMYIFLSYVSHAKYDRLIPSVTFVIRLDTSSKMYRTTIIKVKAVSIATVRGYRQWHHTKVCGSYAVKASGRDRSNRSEIIHEIPMSIVIVLAKLFEKRRRIKVRRNACAKEDAAWRFRDRLELQTFLPLLFSFSPFFISLIRTSLFPPRLFRPQGILRGKTWKARSSFAPLSLRLSA